MIKLQEVKTGDLVWADFEGKRSIGEVLDLDLAQRKVLLEEGENEFWYDVDDLYAIPIDDSVMDELGFVKGEVEGVGYRFDRGPFTFTRSFDGQESWLHYRDEVRHLRNLEHLHQLQHHYRSMTNFGLIFRE